MGPASDEHRGRSAASRIDRRVRHRDADQVDQGEGEADCYAGESYWSALVCGAEMPVRNMNVITTSHTSAAASEYSPGECAP